MSETLVIPTKTDRREAFRKASWDERVAMHKAIAAHKAGVLAERRELGRRYLADHPATFDVPYERAVAVTDTLIDVSAAARAEAIALADGAVAQANNGALEFPVLAHEFPADGPTLRLGMAPEVMAPIVRYFGMLPVLFNFFVTRAHTTELLPTTAHLFHLDPEDTISFKVFVHLSEVDEDCGPFHALPAHITEEILAERGYRGIDRITDEAMADLAGWENVVRFTGPPGATAFADTTRCFHFGGRPRKPGKPVRDMVVYQYLLPTSLLFPIDGDGKRPNFLPQLEPTGDPTWDAMIGATLT